MVSDSIPNAATAAVSSTPKDFAKKKRVNRSAKLKQYKLDARREQWLSQVKNKGGPKETVGGLESLDHARGMPVEKLEIKPSVELEFYSSDLHHESDCESLPSASPSSHGSSISGSNDYVVNFTSSSSRSGSGSSSSGVFSGTMSEEDEGVVDDDSCLDDWEALADALAASENNEQDHTPNSGSVSPHGSIANQSTSGNDISTAEHGCVEHALQIPVKLCQAWKADDAFRPQSLPNLSKPYFVQGGSVWGQKTVAPTPTSCPICYEDLDCTDSSFLPCSCGFRLCLFCHKKILEGDGRCPCCRKEYDYNPLEGETVLDGGSLTYSLPRSSSMIARS